MSGRGTGFVVDNRPDEDREKVVDYLRKWCNASDRFDIATGYFEIGALSQLDGDWQKLDKIRILMGDQTSPSTKSKILEGVRSELDHSFDAEKDRHYFMEAVPRIVEAIRSGKIEIKIYSKHKFHAKLYLTHAKPELEVVPSVALVGSSNFTIPGTSKNIELNVRVDPQSQVEELQEWFEEFWEEAEGVSDEILQTIEPHVREYEPFLVYGRALEEYFRGREVTVGGWLNDEKDEEGKYVAEGDLNFSQMYYKLDQYQKDGFLNMMKIADNWRGGFLCDGVGLGKTYIGLAILEYLAGFKHQRVLLISPKSVHDAVWSHELKDKLGHLYTKRGMGNIHAIKKTELINLEESDADFIRNYFDAIVIDEGHHFRNRQKNKSYEALRSIINDGPEGTKQVFFLTATPINNDIFDLYRMISLFTNDDDEHFARMGVHNLKGHFLKMKRDLAILMTDDEESDVDVQAGLTKPEASDRLRNDDLVNELVVQRSRAFVRASMEGAEREIRFPVPSPPRVGAYDLERVYGDLLHEFVTAFDRQNPLFKLSIYYPYNRFLGKESEDNEFAMEKGRLQAIARLIRTNFLKRFESSFKAFQASCHNLMLKNLAWLKHYGSEGELEGRLSSWQEDNRMHIDRARELNPNYEELDEDQDPLGDLDETNLTNWASEGDFDIEGIVEDTYDDLTQLVRFLSLMETITPETDDKLRILEELLNSAEIGAARKVIVFTEYRDTALYLEEQLKSRITDRVIDEIDSQSKSDRVKLIRRFSPYYNNSSSAEIEEKGDEEIDVLISTDVLAEGLNLQDATRLINYDIHWNPVRLMQRIGRIDRRLNPEAEDNIVADHPSLAEERGKVAYWNFLPPDQLNDVLGLFERVSGKILHISKVLGIEGGYGLTEDQEVDHLKDFNELYEGKRSVEEELRLIFQRLCREHGPIEQDGTGKRERWKEMPTRTISGKRGEGRFAFFCYSIPGPTIEGGEDGDAEFWTHKDGHSRWYLCDLESDDILDKTSEMMVVNGAIECEPGEGRVMNLSEDEFSEARQKVEDHIFEGIMQDLKVPHQNPDGSKIDQKLICWMSVA